MRNIDGGNDHNQYVDQIYKKYHPRLRQYFLSQLGSTSEVDDYVQETIRRFFVFMEGRCWEEEIDYISVYLMRIASIFCSEKLADKRS